MFAYPLPSILIHFQPILIEWKSIKSYWNLRKILHFIIIALFPLFGVYSWALWGTLVCKITSPLHKSDQDRDHELLLEHAFWKLEHRQEPSAICKYQTNLPGNLERVSGERFQKKKQCHVKVTSTTNIVATHGTHVDLLVLMQRVPSSVTCCVNHM